MATNPSHPSTAASAPSSPSATTEKTNPNTAPVAPSFAEFLKTLEDGTLHEELSEKLAGLVVFLQQYAAAVGGKPKGRLTLSLELKLDRGLFEIDADVVVKEPKTIRGRSVLYGAADGSLSPHNPQQIDAFRDVSTPATAPRTLALR